MKINIQKQKNNTKMKVNIQKGKSIIKMKKYYKNRKVL